MSSTTTCKRWFVTFDDKECTPVPIDVIVYMSQCSANIHRPRVIRGHCKIPKHGAVNVAVNLGDCGYNQKPADAYTGYASAFRIFIEEVSSPQL